MKNKTNNKRKTARKPKRAQSNAKTTDRSLLNQILSTAGHFGGMAIAGPAGAYQGTRLGQSLSKWLGAGDYEVASNSLTNPRVLNMHSNNQSIVVRHKEFIRDVVSASTPNTFKLLSLPINPGLSHSFPWLSGVAQQYQEYEFKGIIYEYVSSSADAIASGTNTALGTVTMATQYRASGTSVFTNKAQMLSSFFASDQKPSENFCHPIECDPKENPFNIHYVRGDTVPPDEDIKLYDVGTFNIATSGVQGTNVVLGELWVTYEVELRKPIDTLWTLEYGNYAHYVAGVAAATRDPMPIGGIIRVDTIGIKFDIVNVISFPTGLLGNYMVTIVDSRASNFPSGPIVVSGYTECVASPIFRNGANNEASTVPANNVLYNTTNRVWTAIITIADAKAEARIFFNQYLSDLANSGFVDVFITQVNGGSPL